MHSQEQEQDSGHKAISDFGRTIYVMAELSGGSPDEWDDAESRLIARLDELASQGALDPSARDEKGRSLLTRAAALGYGFVVERLLQMPTSGKALDLADQQGLTAYQHAEVALRQTFKACHPVIENPFALVPLLVMFPYYVDRNPYPGISAMLREAGANTDLRALKVNWLETCTNPDTELRAKVKNAQDLRGLLMQAVTDVVRDECRNKVEEVRLLMLDLFGGEDMKPKRRREVDDAIAATLAECDA